MSSSGMEASHTSAHKGVFVVAVIFSGHIWVCFDGCASCACSGRKITSTTIYSLVFKQDFSLDFETGCTK